MKSRDTLIKLHRFRWTRRSRNSPVWRRSAPMERKSVELDVHLSESRRRPENEIGRFAYPRSASASIRERKEKLAAADR